MDYHTRNEPFRFIFAPPLETKFKIIQLEGKPVQTSEGIAKIIDLSPHGMKLETSLNMPTSRELELAFEFTLNQTSFILEGEILWHKGNQYGLRLDIKKSTEEQLVKEIKFYAKTHK
ncbi:PilZ domain-containing protein [Ammoniphilus resinae]|uniref:PilZ domain-containing protein n=1 Tax=Ammoniphilus resinae TaxID=861532 RepID=A0ABS4GUZ0_9BACL|nr:PilZ domain-containing protein [Ammoniphilus resinae]MBP1934080.1 hypothetical protein [Ammoniphilus resinae]